MTDEPPQETGRLWTPPENYYEQIGESSPNRIVNSLGRLGISIYTFVAFGKPQIITTSAFEEAKPTFADGNIIVASVHRDERDTVILPIVLEDKDVRIHLSRPVAKSDLFVNPFLGRFFHALGAFAVDRKNTDKEGLNHAQNRILARGGNITVYPEGTRIRKDTDKVLEVKRNIVYAAAENNSLIVPVGIAGLSTETDGEGKNRVKISRDGRSRFGLAKPIILGRRGPRLVFAFADPLRFGPLPESVTGFSGIPTEESEIARKAESLRRAELIRFAMQEALDMAIEHRGSTQEYKFKG